MKSVALALLGLALAVPAHAQSHRELDAHVHGVTTLELAMEGGVVEMTFRAPGMDIVGFEHAPHTDADREAIDAALQLMRTPATLVTLPAAADCQLTQARVRHHAGDPEGDAEPGGHAAEEAHDHDAGGHSTFEVTYTFACRHPDALDRIAFPFFAQFPNAREIEAQYVTDAGTGTAEIGRDTAGLALK